MVKDELVDAMETAIKEKLKMAWELIKDDIAMQMETLM